MLDLKKEVKFEKIRKGEEMKDNIGKMLWLDFKKRVTSLFLGNRTSTEE